MRADESVVISVADLARRLGEPDVVLLHVGDRAEYDRAHIPGARHVALADISVSDRSGRGLALEMPPPDQLRARLASLGISDRSRIVVYYARTGCRGNQIFDLRAPEEEPLGNDGSSCNHPDVLIQVLPFQQSTIYAAPKRGRLEPVSGVGDEAWLYENPAGFAELYVRIDRRSLTLLRDIGPGQTLASVHPGVMVLAIALVPRLK